MNDPKLVAQSKAGVLRAMQQFALEQSVEESVKVTSEPESAGRQICAACGSANRKGNSFCASCGVPLQKAAEGAEIAPPNPASATEAPGDHHYHHHYHHHYFSSVGGMDALAGPDVRAAGVRYPARDIARARLRWAGHR